MSERRNDFKALQAEEFHTQFVAAINAGDVAAATSFYADDVVNVTSEGELVIGVDHASKGVSEFIAMEPVMRNTTRLLARYDDIAIVTSDWSATAKNEDGEEVIVSGRGLEVIRKQPDGRWIHVIDVPDVRALHKDT